MDYALFLSKQILQVKGTEDLRLRVRRARPADVPRVLRFVREYSRLAWPGEEKKPGVNNHVVLSDYVTRTLAQGSYVYLGFMFSNWIKLS